MVRDVWRNLGVPGCVTKCDRGRGSKLAKNSVTYFMDGPLGVTKLWWHPAHLFLSKQLLRLLHVIKQISSWMISSLSYGCLNSSKTEFILPGLQAQLLSISRSLSLSLALSLSLLFSISLYLPFYLSLTLSACLSDCLFVCLSLTHFLSVWFFHPDNSICFREMLVA